MKIAVIGAGAVGSVIGGLLARAGESVVLIGRAAHVESINAHGLTISGAHGTIHVILPAAETLDFVPDLALLCVKTQDLADVLKQHEHWLTGVPVITTQNGMQADAIAAAALGAEHVIGGVVLFGATYLEPGKVDYAPAGMLVIGELTRASQERTRMIASVLNKAIPTAVSENIRGAHWTKLIVNQANALPTITGKPFHDTYAEPYLRQLSVWLMREAVRMIRKSGGTLGAMPTTPLTLIKLLMGMPMPVAEMLPRMYLRRLGESPAYGSTLQSVKRGRATEIDYLNGEIVALGAKLNLPTPYNSSVVAMVHEVEQRGEFFSTGEIKARVQAALKDADR